MLSDGTPWRPLVHAEDIARRRRSPRSPRRADVVRGRAFNVGTERNNRTVAEIAQAVVEAVPGSKLAITGETGNDPRSYRVDFARARKELGFEAQLDDPGRRRPAGQGVPRARPHPGGSSTSASPASPCSPRRQKAGELDDTMRVRG